MRLFCVSSSCTACGECTLQTSLLLEDATGHVYPAADRYIKDSDLPFANELVNMCPAHALSIIEKKAAVLDPDEMITQLKQKLESVEIPNKPNCDLSFCPEKYQISYALVPDEGCYDYSSEREALSEGRSRFSEMFWDRRKEFALSYLAQYKVDVLSPFYNFSDLDRTWYAQFSKRIEEILKKAKAELCAATGNDEILPWDFTTFRPESNEDFQSRCKHQAGDIDSTSYVDAFFDGFDESRYKQRYFEEFICSRSQYTVVGQNRRGDNKYKFLYAFCKVNEQGQRLVERIGNCLKYAASYSSRLAIDKAAERNILPSLINDYQNLVRETIKKKVDAYSDALKKKDPAKKAVKQSNHAVLITPTNDTVVKLQTPPTNDAEVKRQTPSEAVDECSDGTVSGIHLETGKKGYRTIQVDLENPVFIGGVKYDHVPVLSVHIFNDMKLRKGSKVKVFRTGDVIPSIQVTEAGTNSLIELPKKCPICNQLLDIKARKLFCGNYKCYGNQMGRLVGYLKGIGVEGYDETALQNVIDGHMRRTMGDGFFLVTEPIDLYKLTSDEKFYPALLEATRTCPDYKILGSIGIPDLGPERAKIIIKTAGGFKKMADFWYDKSNLHDGIIKTLPASIAQIVTTMMKTTAVNEFLNRIVQYMENFTTDWSDKILVGHTGYTPTTQIIEICKKEGFEITDGKKFDLLITGDFSSKSDKMMKAIEKDIPIYNEASFVDRYDRDHTTYNRYDLEQWRRPSINRDLDYDPVI